MLCLSTPTTADVEWERQFPLPQGAGLNDIVLLDANTAVAVGWHGTILRTNDAGATWEVTAAVDGTTEGLMQVAAAGTRLFAIGYYGAFLRSEDGGASWVSHPSPATVRLKTIAFLDANTGYLASVNELFRTDSGGMSWVPRPLPPETPPVAFNAVAMATSQLIMAVGTRSFLTYDDGGNWLDRTAFIPGGNDVHFYDAATAVVAHHNNVYLSTDSAQTFTLIGTETKLPSETEASVNGVRIALPSVILFGSRYNYHYHPVYTGFLSHGSLYNTFDTGSSWTETDAGCAVRAIDTWQGTAVSVGDGGQVYWSTNYGFAWTKVGGYIAPQLGAPGQTFLDINTGVVFDHYGAGQYEERTYVWRTDDGGEAWSQSALMDNFDIQDVAFRDSNSLLAVGQESGAYGVVRHSHDGGATWLTIHSAFEWNPPPPREYRFNGIDICDTGYAIAVGESDSSGTEGEVVTISAYTVTEQARPGTGRLADVSMSDCNHAVAVGDNGTVIVTSDGGVSWTPGVSGIAENLVAVQCVSSSTAFVVGDNGTFLVTSDGGLTWTPRSVGTTDDIYDLSFIDAIEGIVVAGSNVLGTSDAGLNWVADPVPTGGSVTGCDYFGGDNMTVTENVFTGFGVLAKRDPQTAILPLTQNRTFSLEPNFPNPFNPSTTIRFTLPAPGHVRLAIFDVAGRRVAELVDRSLGGGPHTMVWDGKDTRGRRVESGVYFYRLETPEGRASRKMVLIK